MNHPSKRRRRHWWRQGAGRWRAQRFCRSATQTVAPTRCHVLLRMRAPSARACRAKRVRRIDHRDVLDLRPLADRQVLPPFGLAIVFALSSSSTRRRSCGWWRRWRCKLRASPKEPWRRRGGHGRMMRTLHVWWSATMRGGTRVWSVWKRPFEMPLMDLEVISQWLWLFCCCA